MKPELALCHREDLHDRPVDPGTPPPPWIPSTINERLRRRLKKDRPTTTITMQIPVDVIESLKTVAAARGFTAYQTLLRSYISDGLRRDEEESDQQATSKLDQEFALSHLPPLIRLKSKVVYKPWSLTNNAPFRALFPVSLLRSRCAQDVDIERAAKIAATLK
jgi:hypothetical protein